MLSWPGVGVGVGVADTDLAVKLVAVVGGAVGTMRWRIHVRGKMGLSRDVYVGQYSRTMDVLMGMDSHYAMHW